MIPTSSKTIERKRRILTAICTVLLLQKNDCTSLPSYSVATKVLTAVQVFKSKLSPFISMSIPIQFEHLKLWQNTQDSHFSTIPL
jgi:hypothetical protein